MLKINIFLIFGFLFLVSCSSQDKKSQTTKKAEIYYNQGTNDLVSKDYTSALNNLLEAYKLAPHDSRIANNLGMAYYFKNDSVTGMKFLNKAIELDANNIDAKVNIATVLMEKGNLEESYNRYQDILKVLTYDKQYRTYFNLGIIELKRNRLKEALGFFRNSIEVNNEYCPAHFELGKIAYDQKQYELALRKFKDASKGVCYNNPEPQFMASLALIKLGRYTLAKNNLEDILLRFPNNDIRDQAKRELLLLKDRASDSDSANLSKREE